MDKRLVTVNEMTKEYEPGKTYYDVFQDFKEEYTEDVILARSNGDVIELSKELFGDENVEFLTYSNLMAYRSYVRGIIMMILRALYRMVGAEKIRKVVLEYTLDSGYYFEIDGDVTISEDLLLQVEEQLNIMVKEDIPFLKRSMRTDKAIELFDSFGMFDKAKLLKYRRSSRVNIYSLGGFYDYYYGPMPYSTAVLKRFKLEKFEDGFVCILPRKNEPKVMPKFNPSYKLYHTMQESNKWGIMLQADTVGALNDLISKGGMNELMLVQEGLHEKRIGDIAQDIFQKKKRLIMIAGPTSSGKTTFSHRLSVQLHTLGLNPHPIGVDDYFVNRDNTPKDENGQFNYECLEAIDVKQFNKDMKNLLAGNEVQLPTYNFLTGEREYTKPKKRLGANDVLVIEGIHGLNDKLSYSLSKDDKYRIYISALTQLNIDEHNRIPTTDGRLLRRIVRDARTRGASARQTISMWNSVQNGENMNIFPYQESADAMFNSALIYEVAILKQYAEPLLFSIPKDAPEYSEAKRLLKFLDYFLGYPGDMIPNNSILREFIGGSILVN